MTLLSRAQVGRVALSVRAMPIVVPVRYMIDKGDLIFNAMGDELRRALHGNIAALQADGFEEDTGQRWTVFATGPVERRVDGLENVILALSTSENATLESNLFCLKPAILSGRWIEFM
ncbi:MAG TPA: pyridoxamine 5'-phosphate oxidase family protein [Acidimicrobiales bacterium]|jgi:hypothetical protein